MSDEGTHAVTGWPIAGTRGRSKRFRNGPLLYHRSYIIALSTRLRSPCHWALLVVDRATAPKDSRTTSFTRFWMIYFCYHNAVILSGFSLLRRDWRYPRLDQMVCVSPPTWQVEKNESVSCPDFCC